MRLVAAMTLATGGRRGYAAFMMRVISRGIAQRRRNPVRQSEPGLRWIHRFSGSSAFFIPAALALASGCAHPDRVADPTALPEMTNSLDLPAWVSTEPPPPAVPVHRASRTLGYAGQGGERTSDTPGSTTAGSPPDAPAAPPTPAADPGTYGAYWGGYYGGYDGSTYGPHYGGHHSGHDGSRTGDRGDSSPSRVQPGDDWPAPRDYGPVFPFNWSNASR